MRRSSVFVSALLASAASAFAITVDFTADLNGANERPTPIPTAATGTATAGAATLACFITPSRGGHGAAHAAAGRSREAVPAHAAAAMADESPVPPGAANRRIASQGDGTDSERALVVDRAT